MVSELPRSRTFSRLLRHSPGIWAGSRSQRTIRDTRHQRQSPCDQLQRRFDTLYDDRLDGRIDGGRYDRKAAEIQADQQRIRAKVSECQGTLPPAKAAVNLLQIPSKAADQFVKQTGAEQRKLLRLVVGEASWQARELRMSFQPPFEQLRLSNSTSARNHTPNIGAGGHSDNWRRKRDSNPRASRPANGFQDRRFQPLTHSSTTYYIRPSSPPPRCASNSSLALNSSSRFITSACWMSPVGGVLP